MKITVPPLTVPQGMTERIKQLNGEQFSVAVAGGFQEIDLDAEALYNGVSIRCTYSVSGIASGTLRDDNPFGLIREISVICSGDYMRRLSGWEAFCIAQIFRGASAPLQFDRLASATGSVSNGVFEIPLDFSVLGIIPEHYGNVPSRFLTSFKLRIDWATSLTDALVANASGGTASVSVVEVNKSLSLESTPAVSGYGSVEHIVQPFTISSSVNSFPLRGIEAGNRYGGFLLVSRTGTYAELSDAAGVTGNVALYLDASNLRDKVSQADLLQSTRTFFPVNYPGTSTRFLLTGTRYLDSARLSQSASGRAALMTLGQFVDATQAKEVRLECDVTAGTNTVVRVVPVRLRGVVQTAGKWKLPVQ